MINLSTQNILIYCEENSVAIETVPSVVFKTRVRDESVEGPNPFRWQDRTTQEIFGGKKIVLFALPGAFTPTCSSTHAPRYEELYDEFKALGVDEVICLSVNDAFVMFQWAKNLGVAKVFMLPDGNGEFTRKMGMLVEKDNLGFGMRSWRYSMYVNDGKIEKMFVEPEFGDNCPTDPFEVSDADTMLAYLKSR
jgi:thioredoxin-dependent peroxiredoxin